MSRSRQSLHLRIGLASIAVVLGAIQAWLTRFAMGPDGVSYLDMGDAYWTGDWHNAVNSYWSPLYAWIQGFFVNVVKPGPHWEYPLVHLVNFLIYVGALLCFDYFLKNFILVSKLTASERRFGFTLSDSSWWILGYAVFASTSLLLIGMFRVSPDMCVAALVYLASGLVLRIRTGHSNWKTYVFLGMVLGFSYLAKAVMFPLSFVFVAVAVAPNKTFRKNLLNRAVALVIFLAVSAPLFVAISYQQGKLTFGESGSWNYALYVNGMRYWETDPSLAHPVRKILPAPPVFEFGEPIGGTYPPWYDPTYWHHGIEPRIYVHGSLRNAWNALGVFAGIFFFLLFGVTLGALLLASVSSGGPVKSFWRSARWWAVAVPALATLAIYAPVHVEGRFIAASVAILLLVVYAGAATQSAVIAQWMRRGVLAASLLALAMVVAGPMVRWPVSNLVYAYPNPVPGPVEAVAADALLRSGVHANDRVGLIWNEEWAHGAVRGAVMARLARVKIVVEETDANGFWKLDTASRQRAVDALQSVGIRAIIARDVPDSLQGGWRRLGDTNYFMYPSGSTN